MRHENGLGFSFKLLNKKDLSKETKRQERAPLNNPWNRKLSPLFLSSIQQCISAHPPHSHTHCIVVEAIDTHSAHVIVGQHAPCLGNVFHTPCLHSVRLIIKENDAAWILHAPYKVLIQVQRVISAVPESWQPIKKPCMSKVQPKPLKQTGVVSRANKLYLSEKQVLHHMLFGQDLPGERLTLQTLVRQISAV